MGRSALRLVASRGSGARTAGNARTLIDVCGIGHDFHYWEGASGARYLHSVYPLLDCPELPKANYIVVRRLANGDCVPLSIGQTQDDAVSLNLAHLRHEAARLGGNELHIHVMTNSAEERATVEHDLTEGQLQRLRDRLWEQAANV
jgi:hypothetical protein